MTELTRSSIEGGRHLSARSKIKSLDDLAEIAAQAHKAGIAVVLCHGVFDLLHMGHVRHLEAARREGGMLLVTVTADPFVNKGPGRPVFNQALRAEMVAALSVVDFVAVNQAPTSENVLRAIKPSVYVKGSDYANVADDLTGKIAAEARIVEEQGGRVFYTEDITFSSSTLLNRHFDVLDPELRAYLDAHRHDGIIDELTRAVDGIKDMRVLFVGETIIDQYDYVKTIGRSSKENMVATQFTNSELFAGGVIAAANHAADFVREVEVVTMLGEIDSYEDLVRASLRPNVKLHVVHRPGMPTVRKRRFIDASFMRKMFEVYYMDDTPLAGEAENALCGLIAEAAKAADVTVVTDFGHGMIGEDAVAAIDAHARFLAVNAQTNSGNIGYNLITKYSKADFVCIDAPEAQMAMHDKRSDIAHLASVSLPEAIDCGRVIVTHGKNGCITWEKTDGVHRIPAFTKTVIDTMGAGDAFLAVTSPLAASGVPLDRVGFIGNAVGALKVGIVGHRRSVEKIPLLKYLTTLWK